VRRQAGFTLVEILVVLAIIGMIMSLVGPRVLSYLTESKYKAARIQVETLASSMELFFIDNSRYPLEAEGLQALVTAPPSLKTWSGPYLRSASVPLDPWGKPYRYTTKDRGRSFVLTFAAPDANSGEEASKNQISSANKL
jgi:general secretion pathway protein G